MILWAVRVPGSAMLSAQQCQLCKHFITFYYILFQDGFKFTKEKLWGSAAISSLVSLSPSPINILYQYIWHNEWTTPRPSNFVLFKFLTFLSHFATSSYQFLVFRYMFAHFGFKFPHIRNIKQYLSCWVWVLAGDMISVLSICY